MMAPSVYTRRTRHPYQAKSLAEMPESLRKIAEQALTSDDQISTIFVVPPQTVPRKSGGLGGVRSVPEQAILFTNNGVLHVQGTKSPEQPPDSIYMHGRDILYARLVVVLLYGRLELCSVTKEGSSRIIVEYNTVGQEALQPGLQNLLQLVCKPVNSRIPVDKSSVVLLEELESQSIKFRNGLKHYALMEGEKLCGFVFQPRILKRYWRIFHKLVAPAGLVALTDRKLILIEEGRSNATSYGWHFTFCPRINITNVDCKANDALYDLRVHLKRHEVKMVQQISLEKALSQAGQNLWESYADLVRESNPLPIL